VLHLASLDQILYRAGYVFNRHVGVRAMLVKQVDSFHSQPLERSLSHPFDLLGPAIQAEAGVRTLDGIMPVTELGTDYNLTTEGFQRFPEEFFVSKRTIHFSCVKEGNPTLDGCTQEGNHFLLIGGSIAKAHAHAA